MTSAVPTGRITTLCCRSSRPVRTITPKGDVTLTNVGLERPPSVDVETPEVFSAMRADDKAQQLWHNVGHGKTAPHNLDKAA